MVGLVPRGLRQQDPDRDTELNLSFFILYLDGGGSVNLPRMYITQEHVWCLMIAPIAADVSVAHFSVFQSLRQTS